MALESTSAAVVETAFALRDLKETSLSHPLVASHPSLNSIIQATIAEQFEFLSPQQATLATSIQSTARVHFCDVEISERIQLVLRGVLQIIQGRFSARGILRVTTSFNHGAAQIRLVASQTLEAPRSLAPDNLASSIESDRLCSILHEQTISGDCVVVLSIKPEFLCIE